MHTIRRGVAFGALRAIDSSQGNAIATPAARRNRRRFVFIVILFSTERVTFVETTHFG
jgi:hypothetical protein